MIIRSRTLKGWMKANFDHGQLEDITCHGCIAGFPGLTYYHDTIKLYDKFSDDIWELVCNMAEESGEDILTTIASFSGAGSVSDRAMFENLLVWFACEQIARELTDGPAPSEE